MDQLKLPPAGSWRPAINLSSLLMSVQLLLAEPNPNDPLDADIVRFKSHKTFQEVSINAL